MIQGIEFLRHLNLRREFDLLWMLTRNQFTLQYKRTHLGILWSLLNPLLLALVFYIAFTVVLKIKRQDFSLFLLSGLFPWTWFAHSVSASTVSIVNHKTMIKKFLFPKHYLIAALIFSESVHFLFSIPILTGLVYYYGKTADWVWLVGIPVFFIIQLYMTLGVSLISSVINVYFRDFQFIVAFFLNILFWLTPILYQLDTVPEAYRLIFLYCNPLSPLILSWRELFMSHNIQTSWLILSVLNSLWIFILGILIFQKFKTHFDEIL